jgi:hypothetical protein
VQTSVNPTGGVADCKPADRFEGTVIGTEKCAFNLARLQAVSGRRTAGAELIGYSGRRPHPLDTAGRPTITRRRSRAFPTTARAPFLRTTKNVSGNNH